MTKIDQLLYSINDLTYYILQSGDPYTIYSLTTSLNIFNNKLESIYINLLNKSLYNNVLHHIIYNTILDKIIN